MRRLPLRLRRGSAGLVLLLQLALGGVSTWHAVASLNGAPTPHLDAGGGADGRVAHDHAGCALCQAGTTAVVVAAPVRPNLPEAPVTITPLFRSPPGAGRLAPTGSHPRAPPGGMG